MKKRRKDEGEWRKVYLPEYKVKERMKLYLTLFSLLFSSFFLFSFSPKHEYHVSVTQIQYNPAIKSFEISMRVFTDDFEKGLSADNGNRRFVLKNNDQNDPVVERYVRKNFLLADSQKKPCSIKYIGKEEEEDATWIYLEIPFQSALEGCKLQNTILMETFEDQVNMTNLKFSSEKKTFLFKKGQVVHSL